jgi:hypothetical protein
MDESERILRIKDCRYREKEEIDRMDETLANRIFSLLNHPEIDAHCMVDAYYYDYSVIPDAIRDVLNLCRDAYLIFGITTKGHLVCKWVDRWDLDSDDPVVDGKVIHSEKKPCELGFIPEIRQSFDNKLLSTPCPNLLKFFEKGMADG